MDQTAENITRSRIRELFSDRRALADSKVTSLEKAIDDHVQPGMTLHLGYSHGRPIAACNALLRRFDGQDPGFTMVSAGFVSVQAGLVSRGLVRKLIVSFLGDNYPAPAPNPVFQRAYRDGKVEIEPQSMLALHQRLAAGAFGFPFAPTRSWRNSSFEQNPSFAVVGNPFGPGDVGVVEALVPDITFVHGIAADPQGNVLISPPFGESEVAAFASRRGVIATVERIVSHDVIRDHSALMRIPGHRVLAVCEVPFGSHPYSLFNPGVPQVSSYVEDYDFFREVRAASRDPDAFECWVDSWIAGVADHEIYLDKLGGQRLNNLRGGAAFGAWEADFDAERRRQIAVADNEVDGLETMVVAAAALLAEKYASDGYGIIEAGVGYANLAAWLACAKLQHEEGRAVEMVAEIGLYGYQPRPGDAFIFANRNLPTAKGMLGVDSVLGLYVGGRHNNCIAIIGAGQIDRQGNVNSTFADDGTYLVGSGGANDITSAVRETIVVVQQSASRLVETLPYVTAPGGSVSTLVTDLGVFEKRDGSLVLTRYHPGAGRDARDIVEKIRSRCGWRLDVADELVPTAPPDAEAVTRLRLFDLRHDFLRKSGG